MACNSYGQRTNRPSVLIIVIFSTVESGFWWNSVFGISSFRDWFKRHFVPTFRPFVTGSLWPRGRCAEIALSSVKLSLTKWGSVLSCCMLWDSRALGHLDLSFQKCFYFITNTFIILWFGGYFCYWQFASSWIPICILYWKCVTVLVTPSAIRVTAEHPDCTHSLVPLWLTSDLPLANMHHPLQPTIVPL
jgi:hypothetical protein